MNLFFLPDYIYFAIKNLNLNLITEIRLKNGQPVIIQYKNEYKYLTRQFVSDKPCDAIVCEKVDVILNSAMENSVYAYSEELLSGFITVDGGIRIGVAGEYITQNGKVVSVKSITSINIRIPHEVIGCGEQIFEIITCNGLKSTVIFSPPGLGKTTILRDLSRLISQKLRLNVLIADERNEISGATASGWAFNLGDRCDVIRGANKLYILENAVRSMQPKVIVTDEIYGKEDERSLTFLSECGIAFFASSHVCDKESLKKFPADYFVGLNGIGAEATVYDKNFNIISNCGTVGNVGKGA